MENKLNLLMLQILSEWKSSLPSLNIHLYQYSSLLSEQAFQEFKCRNFFISSDKLKSTYSATYSSGVQEEVSASGMNFRFIGVLSVTLK